MTTEEVDCFIDYLTQDTRKSYFVGAWFETRPYRTPTALHFSYFCSYSFLINPLLSNSATRLGSMNSSGLRLRISGRVDAT